MKFYSVLALVGLTTLLVSCASGDKKEETTQAGSEMPVAANTTTTTTTEALPAVAPSSTGAVTQETTTTTMESSTTVATVDYTVVSGDSLWKIAREHRTSVARIKAINGLTSDKLMPGQVIKVPAANP